MTLTWTKASPRFLTAVLPSGDVYTLVRDRHDTRYWHASWTPAEEQAAGTLFNFKVTDSEGTPAWAKQKAAAHAEKVQEKRAAGATWTGGAWRYAAKKNPAPLRGAPRAGQGRKQAPRYKEEYEPEDFARLVAQGSIRVTDTGSENTYGVDREGRRVFSKNYPKHNPSAPPRRGAAAKRKRNPPSWDQGAYEAGMAKSRQIGIDNAETAIDQRKTYPSVRAAYAAYIVNAIDTVTERRLPGREGAVQAFLDHVAKPRKRRK